MFAFVAWFTDHPARSQEILERARRHLSEVVPEGWQEATWAGTGWGVLVRQARSGALTWPFGDQTEGVTTVSAGLPLGLEPTTPGALGRRLLSGEEIHRDACAPFALLAIDETAGRVVVQQDWHGMGQMFRYAKGPTVAFSNRPTALPTSLGEELKPHVRGWSYYLGHGAFAADSSPVRGVSLLEPGVAVTGVRSGRSWTFTSERRWNLDDIVAEAAARPVDLDTIAEAAAEGMRRVVQGLGHYWRQPLAMGLSGGKDSRMLAAVLVDAGLISAFRTNEQNPLEGEVARELATRLEKSRGFALEHEFYVANQTEDVLSAGVADRAARVQAQNDYMFRSTYLNRPLLEPLPETFPRPGILGVLGEYVSDSWLPESWRQDPSQANLAEIPQVLTTKLTKAVPRAALAPQVVERLEAYVEDIYGQAREHGLNPFATLSYCYMKGRRLRDSTALTHVEQVMPFAVPEMIRAAVQMRPGEKVARSLHETLIARHAPEWRDVPFVRLRTGVREEDKLRIWHGTGAADLKALLDHEAGPVTRLMKRPFVARTLRRVSEGTGGGGPEDATLRQFAMAAVAERALFSP